jgi:vacuolar-type H+-ATPase subunit I/STV1
MLTARKNKKVNKGMLVETPMKRFHLAVPIEYEQETLKEISKLGVVLFKRVRSTEENEFPERMHAKLLALRDKIDTILPKAKVKEHAVNYAEELANLDQLQKFVDLSETKLGESIKSIAEIEAEIKNLREVEERLRFLKMHGLRIDDIGNFKHIFVKAGFMKNSLLQKLKWHTEGVTSAVYITGFERAEEKFVAITGLNDDQTYVEAVLKLLNFEEFIFPQELSPEPKDALEEVENRIFSGEKQIQDLKEDLQRIKEKLDFALWMDMAKLSPPIVVRTESMSIISGCIPDNKADALKTLIEKTVPKENSYLQFET